MNENDSLSVRELLKSVYERLKEVLDCEERKVPKHELRVAIAAMCYDSILFAKIGEKNFIIGFGRKCGQYSDYYYDSDIMILEVPFKSIKKPESLKDISRHMKENSGFRGSVLVGLHNGRLVGWQNKKDLLFYHPPTNLKNFNFSLPTNLSEFIAQDMKTNPKVVNLDRSSVVNEGVRYRPELIGVLVSLIKKSLFFF